jgi:predicted nucleic acid-binding Zn ribbon protein
VRHEYEVNCEACGNRWRVVVESDIELEQLECLACGADMFDLTELGRHFEP